MTKGRTRWSLHSFLKKEIAEFFVGQFLSLSPTVTHQIDVMNHAALMDAAPRS
jgi:hypothetical protein